ncbi:PREDICTED: probable cytochrome P450 6a14 [Polistes canadensis]|uniref:probable cytochrome P450 6a14 n=1 Tax=Polistes canadensis TaxID=91411 RepID=UPI000718BDCC|nr:PREDICTED: probable cytochrome P450 6a14 [Polistes canadensis]XP_014616609.1 PREDICTED: probable cytochrome P450 6a14 [Polistes canadensis]
MPTTLELLFGLIAIIVALYYYYTSTFNFWKERGVAGPKPYPIIGNLGRALLGKVSTGDYLKELYDNPEYKNEPMIGIFIKKSPVLILKDLDMIKNVLIKDFSKICDRGVVTSPKVEPLSQHLFSLEPKKWRPLRTRLSPIFTSGKLKEMFGLIIECADHYENYLEKIVSRGEPIECRELTAKFTTDVIGSCAFGLEMNAIGDEDSEFRKMGRSVFEVSFLNILRNRIRNMAPWLLNILIYFIRRDKVTAFFKGSIVNTIKYREDNNIYRNDFVNLLMELKKNPEKLNGIELTDDLLAAQAFVFFLAGFETSSTTITHALYELALNPTMQDKLRQEINELYEHNGEKLQYEDVKEMVYLDQIFRETLRKYPPVTFLMRKTMTDYTFEHTKVTIPKDIKIWIPIYAIQRDPAIFSSPDVFKPERFSDEMNKTRHAMTYLPFGDGPRNCIGSRFAVYQTKIGLIKTLRKFKVEICDKTPIPYKNNPNTFILSPTEQIYLKFRKIDQDHI